MYCLNMGRRKLLMLSPHELINKVCSDVYYEKKVSSSPRNQQVTIRNGWVQSPYSCEDGNSQILQDTSQRAEAQYIEASIRETLVNLGPVALLVRAAKAHPRTRTRSLLHCSQEEFIQPARSATSRIS